MSLTHTPRVARDIAKIAAARNSHTRVLLTGVTGVGKSMLLDASAQQCTSQQIPHLVVAPDTTDFSAIPHETVLLIPNIEQLSPTALDQLTSEPESRTIVATLSDHASTQTQVDEHEEHAACLDRFTRSAHTVPIELYSAADLERLLHRLSPSPLDVRALNRLIELSWGRPEWATRLIHALTENPEIRGLLGKPVVDAVLARYFSEVASATHAHTANLTPEAAAHAIVLAEIGPRSYNGVVDLIGFPSTHQLVSTGLLSQTPDSEDRWGVPLLLTPALIAHSDAATLGDSYQRIVSQLLTQEQLGLPLTEAEERVSVFALMSHQPLAEEALTDHPNTVNLLTRRMRRQICFGAADPAKDLMLRLQRHGSGLCQLTKARLITLLHDSHAGLQALLFEDDLAGNCSVPMHDEQHRLGLMFFRGQLAAQTGTAYSADGNARTDEPEWVDSLTVVQAWNRTDELSRELPELERIATQHPRAEVQLLAELLCNIEYRARGQQSSIVHSAPFTQRLTDAFRAQSEASVKSNKLDDVYITLVIASQLTGLYDPAVNDDLALTTRFVQRLSGDIEHAVWAAHLEAAKVALHCGNLARFELEMRLFKSSLPVFVPVRLTRYVNDFIAAAENGEAHISQGYASQLVSYMAGQYEGVFLFPKVAHTERAEVIAQASALTAIGAHLAASSEQNPASLMRVSARLRELQLWGPARNALDEALKIYTGRRASGKCAVVEGEITALDRDTQEHVLWRAPKVDPTPATARLTRREIETAQLVAQGLSNLEIAESLHCSVRTVESHISNARAKLGAHNRAELARRISLTE